MNDDRPSSVFPEQDRLIKNYSSNGAPLAEDVDVVIAPTQLSRVLLLMLTRWKLSVFLGARFFFFPVWASVEMRC